MAIVKTKKKMNWLSNIFIEIVWGIFGNNRGMQKVNIIILKLRWVCI